MAPGTSPIPDPQGPIPAEDVRAALEKILRSPGLVNSAQLCRFLRYAVERTLAGESGALKENLLGTDVFERGHRFDPRRDPVVRVEARRLRSKLDEYYAGEGATDPVVIRLPKGTYVPVFERLEVLPAAGPAPLEPPVAKPGSQRWWIAAVLIVALAAGMTAWFRRAGPPAAGPLSLAVLPFSSLGADQETEYFADGLTDEVLDLLGRTDGLRMVARSSVFQYKNRNGDAREIARQLNADLILEGSVRKQGQRVRISAELVDARNGYQLWSETLEREGAQVFAVQREIASAIASKLRVHLPGDHSKDYAGDLEAYNLCLKGRYYWNKRTVPGFEAAIAAFREAIERDPNYALAWAGLADSYTMLGFLHARAPLEVRKPAAEAASRAVELDDKLAEAHVAQGNVRALFDWDWAGAEASLRRAIELNPKSALPHYGLSKILASLGHLDEGLVEVRRAQDLDPLSLIMAASTGWELAAARRYKESDAAFRAVAEMDSNFIWTYILRAWSYEARGEFDKAVADLRRATELSNSGTVALGELAHALGRSGHKQEAAAILAQLEARAKQQYVSAFDLSRAYEGLGRRDDAMAALARACDELSPMVCFLKIEPMFDPMRGDPRYPALLKRLHME